MTDVEQREAPDLGRIFSGPVRWGFEPVTPRPVQVSPERDRPPIMRLPALVPAAADTGVGQITTRIFAAAAITLVLDPVAGAVSGALLSVVSVAAAGASAWATAAFRARTNLGKPGVYEAISIGFLCFLIPPIGLLVQGFMARSRSAQIHQQLVPDTKAVAAAQHDHELAMVDWQRRVSEFEMSEQKRVNEASHWFPVVPSPGSHLICAFGGSSLTWAHALVTLGGSMLGSRGRVFIVDVSRRKCVDELWRLAQRQGYPVYPKSVPSDTPMLPSLGKMTWDTLTAIVSEVGHSAQRDAAQSLTDRREDRAVLREVAGCLDGHAPVSITRLEAALRVVASGGPGDGTLSDEEYDRLTVLYNDVQRQHGGVMERVTRLERMLRELHVLEPSAGERGQGEPVSALRVASIDKRADELDSEIFSDLFVQLLLQSMRQGAVAANFLILLGADRVSKRSLESLSTYAERERLPTFLFFEHLRDDAVQVIGGGGAAAAFFALANHREAQEAVNFIGSQYKWVESQHTRSYGQSVTRSRGTEQSENVSYSFTRGFSSGEGGMSVLRHLTESRGTSVGQTQSEARAKSEENSTSVQRVHEAVIEPEVLMGLPVTGMIYVEVQLGGQRITASVDCNPEISYFPRVASEPRARPAQRNATPL